MHDAVSANSTASDFVQVTMSVCAPSTYTTMLPQVSGVGGLPHIVGRSIFGPPYSPADLLL